MHARVDDVVGALARSGGTVAVAESLTGGALTASLVAVPGVSAVLRGGVVAYATDLKAGLLGVDQDLLDRHGPVHPAVAAQMATGVARLLGADHALATTGVAGPGPSDGHPAGTVHVAALGRSGSPVVRSLHLAGDRAAVRAATVHVAMVLLGTVVRPWPVPGADPAEHLRPDRR